MNKTNREAHEEWAGMGLEDAFFRFNKIDPADPAEPTAPELEPCPLCHEPKDFQIEQRLGYKPEIVCNNCGIALQGENVKAATERWNRRTEKQK